MNPQAEADRILSRAVTSVCDGWTEPKHARRILTYGDPSRISHGMCPDCERAVQADADDYYQDHMRIMPDPRD